MFQRLIGFTLHLAPLPRRTGRQERCGTAVAARSSEVTVMRPIVFVLLGGVASLLGACKDNCHSSGAEDCGDKCGNLYAPTCVDGELVCEKRTGPCPGGKKGVGEACRAGECYGTMICEAPVDGCAPFAEQEGICAWTACYSSSPPACGCDGKVYASACAAQEASVNLATSCPSAVKPAGTFRCGPYFCDPDKTYCWFGPDPLMGTTYGCIPLLDGCKEGAIACSCLYLKQADSCATVDDEGVSGIRVDSPK